MGQMWCLHYHGVSVIRLHSVLDGIEPGGTVAVSTIGVKRSDDAYHMWAEGMDEAIRKLKPEHVIVYGGDIGYQFPCEVTYIQNAVTERMKNSGR